MQGQQRHALGTLVPEIGVARERDRVEKARRITAAASGERQQKFKRAFDRCRLARFSGGARRALPQSCRKIDVGRGNRGKCFEHGADRWLLCQRGMRMPAERNPGTRERFAQNGCLRVGAVEDGEIGKGERRFPPTGAAAVDREEA